MEIKEIIKLYKSVFGVGPESVRRLPGAGSSRRYYRVFSPPQSASDVIPATVIACVGDNVCENRAFVDLSGAFAKYASDVAVPHIYAVSGDGKVYLQTDFGDTSLMDLILRNRKGNFSDDSLKEILRASLSALVRLQCVDIGHIGDCLMCGPFSARQVLWDLNYFKYEFLKPAEVCFDEWRLEDDFEALCRDILSCPESIWGFMYRDFQSRNIIACDSGISDVLTARSARDACLFRPGFIDYQGGMFGPAIYDAVSFLWQSKAGFSDGLRNEMLDYYASEYSSVRGVPESDVRESAGLFALFRTLQVLGAYGFRGLVQKKSHFIESIPGAIGNLRSLIEKEIADSYPELKMSCMALINDARWNPQVSEGLTVNVFSFSYKKGGYPVDYSGNGGGFMFDCRAMHNPGRYEEYKSLTGEDDAVATFLEERGEVQGFLKEALSLVDKSVETYIRRGFSSLQVGFGCTGGQHRSVYCARHAAEHLAAEFPEARIVLFHREQMRRPIEIKGFGGNEIYDN